ncbi:TPA: hypothetical protein ACH3X3_013414 [Trebouxia sp. C0006]
MQECPAEKRKQTPPEPISNPSPVQIAPGPFLPPARSGVGPASSVTGAVGSGHSASPTTGGQASWPTLTAQQVICHPAPIGLERFDLPPMPLAAANLRAVSS